MNFILNSDTAGGIKMLTEQRKGGWGPGRSPVWRGPGHPRVPGSLYPRGGEVQWGGIGPGRP